MSFGCLDRPRTLHALMEKIAACTIFEGGDDASNVMYIGGLRVALSFVGVGI